MECLHLDGIGRMRQIIVDHGYKFDGHQRTFIQKNRGFDFKATVWARVMMPVFLSLVLVETVCGQTIRGLAFIGTGLLTLDKERFLFGIMDVVSVIVQVVALPVIGIFAVFSPGKAANEFKKMELKFGNKIYKNRDPNYMPADYYTLTINSNRKVHQFREVTSEIIEGIFSLPKGIVEGITQTGTALLSGNWRKAYRAFIRKEICSYYAPFSTIFYAKGCSGSSLSQEMLGIEIIEEYQFPIYEDITPRQTEYSDLEIHI